jgi:cation diffusion facilitator CzcD-associated flavoprotein CzcO
MMEEIPAIRTDPRTGRKIFATRAAPAYPSINGSGYRIVDDSKLTTLPAASPGSEFDETQERYRVERDIRRGAASYVPLEGDFAQYQGDVYSAAPVPRDTLNDNCDVLVVGAGFAGLMLCQKLVAAGFDDVRFCERGGDVGGTWYWNRYPGIACDVESYSYLPLLDEMHYIPTMKFASGFEIYSYCQMIAERIGFYERCLFNTAVEEAQWSEELQQWRVLTNRGDDMTARILILANGLLTTPRLARINGMESFRGRWFHTSRWDYSVDLQDKRIGVIGTGATAVQVVPELAKVASELHVFQRTPSTIDIRGQRETTAEERLEWTNKSGWSRARRARFAALPFGRAPMLADDDYLAGKVEQKTRDFTGHGSLSPEQMVQNQLRANFRLMERIRARVDEVVADPATAAALKPYYTYGCKRPAFHDEYLPCFNLPNVHLIDTAPTGVELINERGVVHDGVEYALDVLVYATGFQYMDSSTFKMVRNAAGESLSQKWARGGTSTFLGVHSNGFPNLLVMTGPQGGGGTLNFTEAIDTHSDYVLWVLTHMRDHEYDVIDVRKQSEEQWAAHCREADIATSWLRDCLSYFNRDGTGRPGDLAYFGGVPTWQQWRQTARDTLEPYEFQASARIGVTGGE